MITPGRVPVRFLPAAGRLEGGGCHAGRTITRAAGRAALSGNDACPRNGTGFFCAPPVPRGMDASGRDMTLGLRQLKVAGAS